LEVVDQGASDEKEEPLSHISEHGAEDKGVGQSDEHGRIDLVVSGEPVHLDKHFKGSEDLRVFQLGRRFSKVSVMVVLNDDKDLVVILDLVKEFLHVVLGHPSAEDVVVFLLILHAGGQLPDIKV